MRKIGAIVKMGSSTVSDESHGRTRFVTEITALERIDLSPPLNEIETAPQGESLTLWPFYFLLNGIWNFFFF